jgi:threonine dehydrogenase-like Zn-dependent dehydrogenase
MRAVRWYGKHDIRVETVPDPHLIDATDAVIKVTSTAICGSDLHLYGGFNPAMEEGDILGHEFMGEVVDVGSQVRKLKKGDRVVIPFAISCGECFFCQETLYSCCDTTNPNKAQAEKVFGHSPAGLFGYSHLVGGYSGGQAEYVRVPHADVGPLKVPDSLSDEHVLFLSDIFPTGYMAVEACNLRGNETVAIWGCGPVGLFAIKSAFLLNAKKVVAIDRVAERLLLAKESGAIVINADHTDVVEALNEMTSGRGPDVCIDAVGMEAHGYGLEGFYDKAKQTVMLESDRPHVLRQAIMSCRKGGTLSIPGVYSGTVDKVPIGALMNKGLTIKTGQTHVHRYLQPLLSLIEEDKIDPRFLITHRLKLSDAPRAYEEFQQKRNGCIKVVLTP